MAKTLIIKGADFSTNSLDKVYFQSTEDIPCTAITLDKIALNLENIGTSTNLSAVKIPANTTDAVNWASTNPDVANVDKNGVVTTVGIGSAIITVTCGNASASCNISVTDVFDGEKIVGLYFSGNGEVDGGNGLTVEDSNVHSCGLCASEGMLGFNYNSATGGASSYYPYIIPKGTSKLKVTLSGNAVGRIKTIDRTLWYNHLTPAQGHSDECKLIKKDGIVSIVDNVTYIDIPVIDGYPEIDAFVMVLRNASGDPFTEDETSGIKLEFV